MPLFMFFIPDAVTTASAREAAAADQLRAVYENIHVTADHEMSAHVLQTLPGEPRQAKRRR